MAPSTVDAVLRHLHARKASLTCAELCRCLESLGYVVYGQATSTHKQYDHPGLPDWEGGSFCCPHRRGDVVLMPYVVRIKGVIERHRYRLEQLRGH